MHKQEAQHYRGTLKAEPAHIKNWARKYYPQRKADHQVGHSVYLYAKSHFQLKHLRVW